MISKFIPAEVLFAEWRKDPDYVAAYDALEDEFALWLVFIRSASSAWVRLARARAPMIWLASANSSSSAS